MVHAGKLLKLFSGRLQSVLLLVVVFSHFAILIPCQVY